MLEKNKSSQSFLYFIYNISGIVKLFYSTNMQTSKHDKLGIQFVVRLYKDHYSNFFILFSMKTFLIFVNIDFSIDVTIFYYF